MTHPSLAFLISPSIIHHSQSAYSHTHIQNRTAASNLILLACQKPHETFQTPQLDPQYVAIGKILRCKTFHHQHTATTAWNQAIQHSAPSPKLTLIYITYLCRINQIPTAKHLLATYPASDSSHARCKIISSYARSQHLNKAVIELLEACKAGYASTAAYTAVLRSAGEHRHGKLSLTFVISALNDTSIELDQVFFNTAIRAVGRCGHVREAFHLFHTMREKDILPTPRTFEGLIYACSHDGKTQGLGKRALIVLDAARAEHCAQVRVLGAAASAVLACGIWQDDRVELLIKDMKNCVDRLGYDGFKKVALDKVKFETKIYDLQRLRSYS